MALNKGAWSNPEGYRGVLIPAMGAVSMSAVHFPPRLQILSTWPHLSSTCPWSTISTAQPQKYLLFPSMPAARAHLAPLTFSILALNPEEGERWSTAVKTYPPTSPTKLVFFPHFIHVTSQWAAQSLQLMEKKGSPKRVLSLLKRFSFDLRKINLVKNLYRLLNTWYMFNECLVVC